MEKKKKFGIFHIKDTSLSVAHFEAHSFDILNGTAVLAFKDEYGVVGAVYHLEQGYFVAVI